MTRRLVLLAMVVSLVIATAAPAIGTPPLSVANGKSTVEVTSVANCPSGPWEMHVKAKVKPNGTTTASFWWKEAGSEVEYSFDLIENPDLGGGALPTVSFFALPDYSQTSFFVEYEELAGTTLDDFVLCFVGERPSQFPDGIADGHALLVVANDYGPGSNQDEVFLTVTVPNSPGLSAGFDTTQTANHVTVRVAE